MGGGNGPTAIAVGDLRSESDSPACPSGAGFETCSEAGRARCQYARWASIILFIGIIPTLSFYVGAQYARTIEIISSGSNALLCAPPNTAQPHAPLPPHNLLPAAPLATFSDSQTISEEYWKSYINHDFGFELSHAEVSPWVQK